MQKSLDITKGCFPYGNKEYGEYSIMKHIPTFYQTTRGKLYEQLSLDM